MAKKMIKRPKILSPYSEKVAAELMRRKLSELSEFFDDGQLLCSRVMPDGKTQTFQIGFGNIHSRINQAMVFVESALGQHDETESA